MASRTSINVARRKTAATLAACVGLWIVLLAVPTASLGDAEPNNLLIQAEGPLAGGVVYDGIASDVDKYFFSIAGPTTIAMTLTAIDCAPSNSGLRLTLLDGDGKAIQQQSAVASNTQPTQTLRLNSAPGTTRYYVMIDQGCINGPTNYTLQIDPATAVVARSAPFASAAALPEPNEHLARAFGPLVADQPYYGLRGTVNDVDWMIFYARGDRVIDIATVAGGGPSCTANICGCTLNVGNEQTTGIQLLDGSGRLLGSAGALGDQVSHIRFTTPPATRRYYVRALCAHEDEDYLLKVGPASTVTSALPPDCKRARKARAKASQQVRLAQGRARHAVGARLASARRTVTRARAREQRAAARTRRLCP